MRTSFGGGTSCDDAVIFGGGVVTCGVVSIALNSRFSIVHSFNQTFWIKLRPVRQKSSTAEDEDENKSRTDLEDVVLKTNLKEIYRDWQNHSSP